jgi:hypothetical protein
VFEHINAADESSRLICPRLEKHYSQLAMRPPIGVEKDFKNLYHDLMKKYALKA